MVRLIGSRRERRQVDALLRRVVDEYAPTNFHEMVWCVLTDAVRPRANGRKPKWLGMDGVFLVADVERVLKAKGWKRDKKKGLPNALASLQASEPQRSATIARPGCMRRTTRRCLLRARVGRSGEGRERTARERAHARR